MVTDKNRFGRTLRRFREDAQKTMGDVADHLDVTVAYISDMERGHKTPFSAPRLRSVCDFLGLTAEQYQQLASYASVSRGSFELDAVNVRPMALQVGAALMRNWGELDDDQLAAIERALKKGH